MAESDLSMAETLTMMMLLRRAHNDTLAVPAWRTPTLPQLAAEVRVSVRHQRRLLIHLSRHEWAKVISGRGRGHKSTYSLLPGGVVPGPCDCSKRGHGNPLLRREKGTWGAPEKGTSARTKAQASNGIAPRGHQGERVKGEALACELCGGPISALRFAQAGPRCSRCADVSADRVGTP